MDPVCHCGYKKSEHEDYARVRGSTLMPMDGNVWDVDSNTKSERTNAFGEVEFVGYGEIGRPVSNTLVMIGGVYKCVIYIFVDFK